MTVKISILMTKYKVEREFETPLQNKLIKKFSTRQNVVNSTFLKLGRKKTVKSFNLNATVDREHIFVQNRIIQNIINVIRSCCSNGSHFFALVLILQFIYLQPLGDKKHFFTMNAIFFYFFQAQNFECNQNVKSTHFL